jgi:hypothetical protein
MTCNRALAYGTRQLLIDRFKHRSEFRLLFLKEPAHVSPPAIREKLSGIHLDLQQVS